MTIQAALDRIQVLAGGMSGVNQAPAVPIEGITQFPFVASYLAGGEIEMVASSKKELYEVWVEFHCSRVLLPEGISQALNFMTAFPPLLMADITLAGAVDTIIFGGNRTFNLSFGGLRWGEDTTIGVRFRFWVKIQSAV